MAYMLRKAHELLRPPRGARAERGEMRVELIGGSLDGLLMDVEGPFLRVPRARMSGICQWHTGEPVFAEVPAAIYAGFTYNPSTGQTGLKFKGYEGSTP